MKPDQEYLVEETLRQDAITEFGGLNSFMSNFAHAQVMLDGVVYQTVEHAYQAAKIVDLANRECIRSAPTPGVAKRRGQKVTIRPDWEFIKISVMRYLLYQKFESPDMKRQLLDTGDTYLQEGNVWGDNYWGIYERRGYNVLGKLLMEVRVSLRSASQPS